MLNVEQDAGLDLDAGNGRHRQRRFFGALCLAFGALAVAVGTTSAETWRGLTVAPEHRCSPYSKKRDYPHPQSVEREIVRRLGAVYGPYTGRCFGSVGETDIEHIVATSEAHDSGLCARDREKRKRFARDLRNLTLASPNLNRYEKAGKDATEWLPERNRCWFATRVVEVRQAYGLTIDRSEALTLEAILTACESTEMTPSACSTNAAPDQGSNASPPNSALCALRRQPQWPNYLQGSPAPWDRSRTPQPSSLTTARLSPQHEGRVQP